MAKSTETDESRVTIKKYSNRRLYDTRESRYITLEDLAGIIQQGATVKVVDAGSGQDLTRQVLTQVILEQQDRLDLIPVELLHAVIRSQGTLQQAPFAAFLSAATQQFASAGHLWAQQMASLFGRLPGFPPAGPVGFDPFGMGAPKEPIASGADRSYEGSRASAGDSDSAKSAEVPPGEEIPYGHPQADEVEELRKRMEALLSRLDKKG